MKIPNLTIVFIVTFPRQHFLHKLGIPYIHFPSYTREEALEIIATSPLEIFNESASPSLDFDQQARAEDDLWLWSRFCAAVWDSLAKGAARDLVSFRALAEKLWRPFVGPIVEGTYGTRDFSRLMVARRILFQGDEPLIDRPVSKEDESSTKISKKGESKHYPETVKR